MNNSYFWFSRIWTNCYILSFWILNYLNICRFRRFRFYICSMTTMRSVYNWIISTCTSSSIIFVATCCRSSCLCWTSCKFWGCCLSNISCFIVNNFTTSCYCCFWSTIVNPFCTTRLSRITPIVTPINTIFFIINFC